MSQKKIREIVTFIKVFFKNRNITISKIVLFGSYARGSSAQSKDSDLDLAIISKDFEQKDIFQRVRMLKGLNRSLVEKFMLPFDIVPISFNEWKKNASPIVSFVRQGQEVLSI